MAFDYHPKLDSFLLNDLYGDDYEAAVDMFETFIQYVVPEFDSIFPLLQNQDRDNLKKTAHKIKPNFTMVGLADMQDMMKQIEIAALDEPDFSQVEALVHNVKEALDQNKLIIMSEIERLKQIS